MFEKKYGNFDASAIQGYYYITGLVHDVQSTSSQLWSKNIFAQ